MNSVVGQLRLIVAVLFLFAAFNLGNLYRQVTGASGDSRIVNYTGIVRGKTQKLVKLVFLQGSYERLGAASQTVPNDGDVNDTEANSASQSQSSQSQLALPSSDIQQKIDDTIPELNQIVEGLANGDRELTLAKVSDANYQANVADLQQAWEQLKVNIDRFLETPTLPRQLQLLDASEAYWDITNETTFAAEANAARNVRRATWLTVILNVSILIFVLTISQRLRTKLKRTIGSLSTSSTQIATTVAQQERVASQQASSVNETTTTMDELEASSRQAAEQAKAAVEAARQAFQASEDGTQAVGESLEGMFDLEAKVEAIAAQIVDLSAQANQISHISKLVVDFANQTNILALNSSVEAVRAGEHGKGFAIVANEIRKLADQSQQSADQINILVADIQKAINETVMVTEAGTKTVKHGVAIAQRTEASFGQIKKATNQVVLNNQQVSLNLKQQVSAIQQVVDAMEAINQGARETASGLGQTKAGSVNLSDAALDLEKIV